MQDAVEYIVWYHKLFGNSLRARKALRQYDSCKALYEAILAGEEINGIDNVALYDKCRAYSIIDAMAVIAQCEENGWDIIPYTSEFYPPELLTIPDYPMLLFADGKKEILTRPAKISVIGSREAKADAEKVAYNASFNLVKTGSVIVSGAALGIDSCAHLGAVEAGGETIGVLGCGLGNSYMKRISSFYERVRKQGVYITEMLPFENVSRFSFPERNRIISGISRAVLVTCAAEKSGSLITAELAKKQHRRVYAVAPEICYSKGCEELLVNGAYYFYNAGDIAYPLRRYYDEDCFNEYYCNAPIGPLTGSFTAEDMAIPKKQKNRKTAEKNAEKTAEKRDVLSEKNDKGQEKKEIVIPDTLSENAKKVYSHLTDSPVQRDFLVGITGLRIPQVLTALSELETAGLIKNVAGSRIEKIN